MRAELDRFLASVKTKEDWDEVWDIVRGRHGMWEASLGRNFTVGDSVSFEIDKGRNRGYYTGVITGMTTRAAKVKTSYMEWTVGFSYLRKKGGDFQ